MIASTRPRFLKRAITRSFNQAADSYDEAAFFQREVCDRLLERLDYILLQPKIILDLGAGTGYATRLLEQRYKKSTAVAFDLAENMLLRSKREKRWFDRKRYVCGDAEKLPFADNSVELIFSSLVLHWTNNIEQVIHELHRVLKPGGLLLFSTLGPDTLYEVKQSWDQVDSAPHVHQFTDMHHIGDYLQRARFADVVVDMEFITLTYNDIKKVLLDLKDLGTHNIAAGRNKGLTGKVKFQQFMHAYEQLRNPEGYIPVTYEVIYGLGWAQPLDDKIKEISIPLDSIQKK